MTYIEMNSTLNIDNVLTFTNKKGDFIFSHIYTLQHFCYIIPQMYARKYIFKAHTQ